MVRLEDLQPNASIKGILPDSLVTVVSVQWYGSEALNLPAGKVAEDLLYRHDEPRLALAEHGLMSAMSGAGPATRSYQVGDTQASAARARAVVMAAERGLGCQPVDREFEKLGYDIESKDPRTGRLRFIEVKRRAAGADVTTVTRNEILYSLNKPEDFILAMVEFGTDGSHCVRYLRRHFQREPDFGVTSVNYDFTELLAQAGQPF